MQTSSRQNRGFASMDSQRQREIARKGGRAAHEKGTAHQFTSDEARAAGRKGGERVSQDRSHMANIGRMGGRRSAGRRQAAKSNPESGGGSTAAESTNASMITSDVDMSQE
jgi:general stress protein YciG